MICEFLDYWLGVNVVEHDSGQDVLRGVFKDDCYASGLIDEPRIFSHQATWRQSNDAVLGLVLRQKMPECLAGFFPERLFGQTLSLKSFQWFTEKRLDFVIQVKERIAQQRGQLCTDGRFPNTTYACEKYLHDNEL